MQDSSKSVWLSCGLFKKEQTCKNGWFYLRVGEFCILFQCHINSLSFFPVFRNISRRLARQIQALEKNL